MRALAQLGLGFVLSATSACGAEAHSPRGGPLDGSQLATSASQDAGADASMETASEDAGAYALSTREGFICARPAVEQGLRFYEAEICAIRVPELCEPRVLCRSHAECQERPHGFCEASVNGVCLYPKQPRSEVLFLCERDQDCREMPGGSCERMIVSARCHYDECAHDHECAPGQRCACQAYYHVCLEADCKSDDECAPGQRCLASSPCAEIVRSYNCTTPSDECHVDADCREVGRPTCAFKEGRFRCVEACIVDFFQ